jgi:hypothetical protein
MSVEKRTQNLKKRGIDIPSIVRESKKKLLYGKIVVENEKMKEYFHTAQSRRWDVNAPFTINRDLIDQASKTVMGIIKDDYDFQCALLEVPENSQMKEILRYIYRKREIISDKNVGNLLDSMENILNADLETLTKDTTVHVLCHSSLYPFDVFKSTDKFIIEQTSRWESQKEFFDDPFYSLTISSPLSFEELIKNIKEFFADKVQSLLKFPQTQQESENFATKLGIVLLQ